PALVQPTVSWLKAQYDEFTVSINTAPTFTKSKGITSGRIPLTGSEWRVPADDWTRLCGKVANGGALYVKVQAIDTDLAKRDPGRRAVSPVITMTATK